MKKLRINDNNIELLNENQLGSFYQDFEIDIVNLTICNISCFRKMCHVIIDNKDEYKNKEVLHKMISDNNFTVLIMNEDIVLID